MDQSMGGFFVNDGGAGKKASQGRFAALRDIYDDPFKW